MRVTMKNTIFWDMKPRNMVTLYRRLKKTCLFHLQGRSLLSPLITFLRNVLKFLPDYTTLLHRRGYSFSVVAVLWRSFWQICLLNTSKTGKKILLPSALRYQKQRYFFGAMTLTGKYRSTRRKACPIFTFSTTNPTWTGPAWSPDLCVGRPATALKTNLIDS